jgi:hypothetical protein
VATSITGLMVGDECWNSGLDVWLVAVVASIHLEAVAAIIQLEAVMAATLKSARLLETLPMTSRVLDPYANPIT